MLLAWSSGIVTVALHSTITPSGLAPIEDVSGTEQGEIRIVPGEGLIQSYRASAVTTYTVALPSGEIARVADEYTTYAELAPR
jgi:hypothetical protein